MKTTPSQLMVGLSLLALASASAFASDPTPVSASQETLKVFSYQTAPAAAAPAPVVVTPVVALGEDADVAKTTPVQMKMVQVKDSPDRQFRAISEAMAFSDPTAARALYTKDLGHNLQLEAFGGPIFPILGEKTPSMANSLAFRW